MPGVRKARQFALEVWEPGRVFRHDDVAAFELHGVAKETLFFRDLRLVAVEDRAEPRVGAEVLQERDAGPRALDDDAVSEPFGLKAPDRVRKRRELHPSPEHIKKEPFAAEMPPGGAHGVIARGVCGDREIPALDDAQ